MVHARGAAALSLLAFLLGFAGCATYSTQSQTLRVLVFSKVQEGAYRHRVIPEGIKTIHEIGVEKGWLVDDTVDPQVFTPKNLARYDVVVWNNTGGDVLEPAGQEAFQDFIRRGGGYVGIHMAVAGKGGTEPGWPWYAQLTGAQFKQHPPGTPMGTITKAADRHPAIADLPNPWTHADEWYEWVADPAAKPMIHILLSVDEKSYSRGTGTHPVSWYQEFEGGRAFYTALGHTADSYTEANFRKHIAGGIEWASTHSLKQKSPDQKQ